jgi:hypothetical protein
MDETESKIEPYEFSNQEEFLEATRNTLAWYNSQILRSLEDKEIPNPIFTRANFLAELRSMAEEKNIVLNDEIAKALDSIAKEAEYNLNNIEFTRETLDTFTEPFHKMLDRHLKAIEDQRLTGATEQ